MNQDLIQKAVDEALAGNWGEAIEANKEILKGDPNDIECLNRLARAYAESGNLTKAKELAQKVLKLDPFNNIAQRSLDKWKNLRKSDVTSSPTHSGLEIFLEEPGKTKVVPLIHLGDLKVLAKIDTGDEVNLNPHPHKASITTFDGKYVGRLSDDLSARLRNLIEAGNEYKVFIKSSDPKEVKIFIKETKKSEKTKNIQSFPGEKVEYVSFTPPELVHKKEDTPVEAPDVEDGEA